VKTPAPRAGGVFSASDERTTPLNTSEKKTNNYLSLLQKLQALTREGEKSKAQWLVEECYRLRHHLPFAVIRGDSSNGLKKPKNTFGEGKNWGRGGKKRYAGEDVPLL